jgi:hypothetical protein
MKTPRQFRTLLAMATLSAVSAVCGAQAANQPGPPSSNSNLTQEAAPIERAYPNQNSYPGVRNGPPPVTSVTLQSGQEIATGAGQKIATPISGVMLRVGPQSVARLVSSDATKVELSVERGVANLDVHDPANDTLILVDLPGGQTQVLKNGLYTFNAETNTARVLKGEALAFPKDATADAKPLKVKEYNKVAFNGKDVRPHEFYPYEASVDLLPLQGPRGEMSGGAGPGYGYGYGPYSDGFYGYPYYPYYAYGYPWAWGYPYPYGYGFYPFGVGLGFSYYGGWGGYRGFGYRGGFPRGRR